MYLSTTALSVSEEEAGVATAWVEEIGVDTAWVVVVAAGFIKARVGGGAMVDSAWEEEMTVMGFVLVGAVEVLKEVAGVLVRAAGVLVGAGLESQCGVLVGIARLATAWDVEL